MFNACIFHIFQIKIPGRVNGKDYSNDEPKERTLIQSKNSTTAFKYFPKAEQMIEKQGKSSLLGLEERYITINYDTCFTVEAETTRISLEGKEMLILRAMFRSSRIGGFRAKVLKVGQDANKGKREKST